VPGPLYRNNRHKITMDSHKNRFARSAGATRKKWGTWYCDSWLLQSRGFHAKCFEAELELRKRQSFGQKISHHLVRGDIREYYVAPDNTVPDGMVNDVNVLSCWADSNVLEERERSLVVSEDGDDRNREAKILEHIPQPECFLGGGTRSIVFSRTGGLSYYARELGLPGHRATVLAVDPSSGGLSASKVTSIISVTVALEGCG
jgi:hypothetical protein